MVGPVDLSEAELGRCGLGVILRRAPAGLSVTRIYCLRCGSQVSPERRDTDPRGWWACARGCNTRYAAIALPLPARPTI